MYFRTKLIRFSQREVTILLQNSNGPCPLIALANVLVLENRLDFQDQGIVNADTIISLIADLLLSSTCNKQNGDSVSTATNLVQIDAILESLPKLLRGLDLNVQFTSVKAMEFTIELSIFDALGIDIYHGWIVDPMQVETAAALGSIGINQVYNTLVSHLEKRQDDVNSFSNGHDNNNNDNDNDNHNNDSRNDKKDESVPQCLEKSIPHVQSQSALEDEGVLLKAFLDDSPSHITYYGLAQLHSEIKERQLAVFFRGAHFSTIFKVNGILYILVTDEGYGDVPSVVWESFETIDGDSDFVNGYFAREASQQNESTPPLAPSVVLTSHNNPYSSTTTDIADDHALAMRLQMQEDQLSFHNIPPHTHTHTHTHSHSHSLAQPSSSNSINTNQFTNDQSNNIRKKANSSCSIM
jgi:ubiquitin carboxyl-terminal hydrolase MINDY-1/2